MNKIFSLYFFIFFCIFQRATVYAKKIKLQPLIIIQINQLLDLSVESFYKEALDSKGKFKGDSVDEMQRLTKNIFHLSHLLPVETAVHFKKIFQALEVQLSLLLKTSKRLYVKQVWKSLFVISRSFNTKTYFYGFCSKDKSMWLQKRKTKPLNPVGLRHCVNAI